MRLKARMPLPAHGLLAGIVSAPARDDLPFARHGRKGDPGNVDDELIVPHAIVLLVHPLGVLLGHPWQRNAVRSPPKPPALRHALTDGHQLHRHPVGEFLNPGRGRRRGGGPCRELLCCLGKPQRGLVNPQLLPDKLRVAGRSPLVLPSTQVELPLLSFKGARAEAISVSLFGPGPVAGTGSGGGRAEGVANEVVSRTDGEGPEEKPKDNSGSRQSSTIRRPGAAMPTMARARPVRRPLERAMEASEPIPSTIPVSRMTRKVIAASQLIWMPALGRASPVQAE